MSCSITLVCVGVSEKRDKRLGKTCPSQYLGMLPRQLLLTPWTTHKNNKRPWKKAKKNVKKEQPLLVRGLPLQPIRGIWMLQPDSTMWQNYPATTSPQPYTVQLKSLFSLNARPPQVPRVRTHPAIPAYLGNITLKKMSLWASQFYCCQRTKMMTRPGSKIGQALTCYALLVPEHNTERRTTQWLVKLIIIVFIIKQKRNTHINRMCV